MASGVTFDFRELTRKLARLKDRMPKAVARSLNRAAVSARAAMVPAVAADMGVKATVVREAIAIRQATPSALVSRVAARGKPIPLIHFNARGPEPTRGRGRGVTYRSKVGKGVIEDAFIATMQSGHRGVFKRVGTSVRKSRGAWSKNLRITELHGPSVPHVFAKHYPLGIARGEESLRQNLKHEISYLFGS